MRAIATLVVLCIGVLISAEIQREPSSPSVAAEFAAPLAPDQLSVNLAHGRITIAGSSVSTAHENTLGELVARHFADAAVSIELRPAILPVNHWETASARLVYVVAALESGAATMLADAIEVRGVTSTPDVLAARVRLLEETLPAEVALTTDVLIARSAASFDELCARAFASLQLGPVSFHESSAELRPGSLGTLDRLTEFARDCQTVTIEIRGHTDATGSETWNRQLSLKRARAVADQIIANGIDPARLVVRGLGSAEPIADNSTRRGRETNRRIEFEIR